MYVVVCADWHMYIVMCWVVEVIPHDGPIELFLIPSNAHN